MSDRRPHRPPRPPGTDQSDGRERPGKPQLPSSRSSPRRSSSGYFSSDSVPASPLSPRPESVHRETQTPTPSAQAVVHALDRLTAEVHTDRGRSDSNPRPADPTRDMQAALVGQELRRHGDEFNRILKQRRHAAGAHRQWFPAVPREPSVLVCVGFLIFLFGRLLHSRGAPYSQSQV